MRLRSISQLDTHSCLKAQPSSTVKKIAWTYYLLTISSVSNTLRSRPNHQSPQGTSEYYSSVQILTSWQNNSHKKNYHSQPPSKTV